MILLNGLFYSCVYNLNLSLLHKVNKHDFEPVRQSNFLIFFVIPHHLLNFVSARILGSTMNE